MINSNVSHPCLMPNEWEDTKTFWIECTSFRSLEPAISELPIATPSILAGLFVIAIASHNLAIYIYRQHRLNRIATRLQQIIALERMLQLKFQKKQ